MIMAVMFDLGGVYFEDGTKKFVAKLSPLVNKNKEELLNFFRTGKSIDYRKNIISGDEFFTWTSKELGSNVTPRDLNIMWVSEYTEMAGIRDLILSLKNGGIKVTILSDNVPERVKYLQEKYQFLDLFDDVVLSYEVNLIKDSSEMFELALSRLNLKPNEVIFVDDKQEKLDIAKELGINTVLFKSVNDLKEDLNHLINKNK